MLSFPVLLAIITAFSLAAGQMLFKLGAASWNGDSLIGWFVSFVTNPFLVVAVFLYAFTVIMWIYVLRVLPLSFAYPITALSYIIVPVASYLILNEKISWQTGVGSLLIIMGVAVSNMKL